MQQKGVKNTMHSIPKEEKTWTEIKHLKRIQIPGA
jgi:hypothetical protein